MKRRLFQGLLIVALLCGAVLLAHPTAAWALAGSGTQDEPYRITTEADLQEFAERVNDGDTDACAVLMGDITINSNVLDEDGNLINNGSGFTPWTPIGDSSKPYVGTFDGQGHTISGLYIDSNAEYAGLFGVIGTNGTVKNLALADSYISISRSDLNTYVGGICGDNWGSITNCSNSGIVNVSGGTYTYVGGICGRNYGGSIGNCDNSGTVTGTDSAIVGGICGENWGSIENCDNSGTVTGAVAGGICGDNRGGSIKGCSNSGTVTGGNVGGICGNNEKGSITGCSNSDTVSVTGSGEVGGICGDNYNGSITTCSNSGDVTGSGTNVGGICGRNTVSSITNCSNSGPVTGTGSGTYVGGICGDNKGGIITSCSNSGTVTGNGNTSDVGGISGYNDHNGSITTCYWLDSTANKGVGVNEAGATMVTEVLSKTADQYASGEVAWLLNGSSTNGPWRQNLSGPDQDVFPTLDPTHGVVGSLGNGAYHNCTYNDTGFCTTCVSYEPAVQDASGTYQINNAGQLYWFAGLVNGGQTTANAELTADITINSNVLNDDGSLNESAADTFTPWTPIGDNYANRYTGTFDGKGHTISGLYIHSDAQYAGLFGYIGEGGTAKKLNLADSYISISCSDNTIVFVYVGGICGQNDGGSITSCSNSGTVSGGSTNSTAYVGGICGRNDGGSIKGCSNSGTVSGSTNNIAYVGGICGGNDGSIKGCSNSGTVTGNGSTTYVGGICGKNYGRIANCSNSGAVTGSGTNVGGICGWNDGSIENCSNSGTVSGSGSSVGGICGYNYKGSITTCYWLDSTAGAGIGDDSGGGEATEKTAEQYASGEVAWLLNKWQDDDLGLNGKVWAMGEDGYPVLNGKSDNSVVQLTFNANTGKEEDNSIAYGNAGSALPNVTLPEITGYTFSGWYDNEALSGDAVTAIPADATGDQTYWAKWTATSSPSTPSTPPTVSEETIDAIADAQPGETVTVDLSSGSTTLDKEVFETLAGKDVTLVVELDDGVSWTVNGTDIPADADFTDIDMGVTMNSDGIPVDLINAITGERSSVQITLAHDGAFGFTMTLTAPLGAENAGYWANLYHFNEDANAMTFETAAEIDSDGSVALSFSHASQYAIVIDDHNHGALTLPFTDVSEGDWFYEPVCFVYSQGLMTGTSATTFEPNTHLTRAMLVAMLHRLEGSPAASAGTFTDVADGDWYAEAVNWAASVGVVNGFDDGSFQPNTAITREQLAAILRNYAAYKGMDVTATGSLAHYTDAASVSTWAKESVEWVVGNGLIGGYGDNTLRPQGTTTRAEVASVLQRYLAHEQ